MYGNGRDVTAKMPTKPAATADKPEWVGVDLAKGPSTLGVWCVLSGAACKRPSECLVRGRCSA
jgi:hypothetical protein